MSPYKWEYMLHFQTNAIQIESVISCLENLTVLVHLEIVKKKTYLGGEKKAVHTTGFAKKWRL